MQYVTYGLMALGVLSFLVEVAAVEAGYALAQAAKYWEKCQIAFLRVVKDAGYIPVIYANRDYLQNYFDMGRITAELGTVYIWYAGYTAALKAGESDIAIWQYTSTAKVPGIKGNADMNRFYIDFETDEVKPDREEKRNINVLDFQRAANLDGYREAAGSRFTEDGKDGPKTQYVRRQINLKAKMSGKKYAAGSTGHVVKWWQRRYNEILGRHQDVDGRYGSTARIDTIALQKQLSLKVDGIAGYNSIQTAFYN